ncbi:hypothetical protein D0Y65_015532 [Glycine soja]|uniref:Uncharacterized protein n=1 Tax=Glycine soja TaxID=3848 RepID=A0A445KDF9_GLYSO|nr:hypothetical protein D0Y65_015532 [Glycine soja]
MSQKLSLEITKFHKDLEQKDKILFAMLRKSELDTVEKQMLLKEVKLSKARRKDPREGPRVLMSLRVDFEPMGYYFYFKAHENLNPRENSSKVNNKEMETYEPETEIEEEKSISGEDSPTTPMQNQTPSKVEADAFEKIASISQTLTTTKQSLWKMDLHALGISYKIKRLKQQLVLVERLTRRQANDELAEITNDSKVSIKIGFYMRLSDKKIVQSTSPTQLVLVNEY